MPDHAHEVLGHSIRVMVVEDHDVVREAVVGQFQRASEIVVCAEAATLADAEAVAADVVPDVIVTDLHLGDRGFIEAARRMRNANPTTKVVVLTAASDRDAFVASMLAGASAYLPKQLRGTDLVGTVRLVASGARLFETATAATLMGDLEETVSDDGRVLALVAQGKTDGEIGHELEMDAETVQQCVARLVALIGPAPALATPVGDKGGGRRGIR